MAKKNETVVPPKSAAAAFAESKVEPTEPKVEAKEPQPTVTEADIERRIQEGIKEGMKTLKASAPSHGLTKEDMAEIMKAVIPTTILALEQAKQLSLHESTLKTMRSKAQLEEKCYICRQSVGDGKGRGCGGPWKRDANGEFMMDSKTGARIEDIETNHVQMVVFPNHPVAERQFDGVQINGAYYRSQGPGHKVWVPRKNDIASMLLKFEEDQLIQQVGRKHMRRNGGTVGPSGHNVAAPTFI